MSKVKCEVMYFKESGKYYAEVEHEIPDNIKSFEVSDYINEVTKNECRGMDICVTKFIGSREEFYEVPFMIRRERRL